MMASSYSTNLACTRGSKGCMYSGMQRGKIRSVTVMFLSLHCSNIGIWLQDCIFAHLFPDLQRRVEKFRSAVTPAAQVLLRKGRRCACSDVHRPLQGSLLIQSPACCWLFGGCWCLGHVYCCQSCIMCNRPTVAGLCVVCCCTAEPGWQSKCLSGARSGGSRAMGLCVWMCDMWPSTSCRQGPNCWPVQPVDHYWDCVQKAGLPVVECHGWRFIPDYEEKLMASVYVSAVMEATAVCLLALATTCLMLLHAWRTAHW